MTARSLSWLEDELAARDNLHLRRRLRERRSAQSGHRIDLDGRTLVNFGCNDYLGFAARLSIDDIDIDGWGSGSSPLIVGRGSEQAQLERELAAFEGTEAAIVFPSGFAANLGTISALVGRGDVVFSDAKNHASIVDGCRLSRARIQVYPHNDVDYLRMMLGQSGAFRRRLIVTDTLFSMDGDLAPLGDLCQLADESDAMLMVDESHATGVFGAKGRGLGEHVGVETGIAVRMGTLSKGLGGIGGFVAGDQLLIDYLANGARSYVYSTAMPDPVAAMGRRSLRMLAEEAEGGARLLATADRLRQVLREDRWSTGDSASQIIPLFFGDPERTMLASQQLSQAGFFVPGIRPPTVPQGESLLRISLTLSHTPEDISGLINALRAVERA